VGGLAGNAGDHGGLGCVNDVRCKGGEAVAAVTTWVSHHTSSTGGKFERVSDDIKAQMDEPALEGTTEGSIFSEELGTWQEGSEDKSMARGFHANTHVDVRETQEDRVSDPIAGHH
jgi:hypothetical protein